MEVDELTKSMAALHVGGAGEDETTSLTTAAESLTTVPDIAEVNAGNAAFQKTLVDLGEEDIDLKGLAVPIAGGDITQQNPAALQTVIDEAIKNELIWDTSTLEGQEGLELKTMSDFASLIVGKKSIESLQKAVQERKYAAVIASGRGEDSAKSSASKARNQALRKFFVNQDGDECPQIWKGVEDVTKRPCWICGVPILSTDPKSGLSFECEHVFPVAQAVFFIDLQKGSKTPKSQVPVLQLEQDASHRVCNQIKNNTHFITASGDLGQRKWIINEKPIRELLLKIQNDTQQLKDERNRIVEKWGIREDFLNKRISAVKTRSEAILKYFNTNECPRPNQKELVIAKLINCRTNFVNVANSFLTKQGVSPIPTGDLGKDIANRISSILTLTDRMKSTPGVDKFIQEMKKLQVVFPTTPSPTTTPQSSRPPSPIVSPAVNYRKRGRAEEEPTAATSEEPPYENILRLSPQTPGSTAAQNIVSSRSSNDIPPAKRAKIQSSNGRTLTPVRTLGAFKKGRRRTRKAKSRNRRTRRKKFTA